MKSQIGLALLSSILATLLPSPTDWFHFYIQNYLYSHRIKRISFELIQIFDWYILDTIYYVLIFILAYSLQLQNNNTISTLTIISTILSLGVIIGLIGKFVTSRKKYRR